MFFSRVNLITVLLRAKERREKKRHAPHAGFLFAPLLHKGDIFFLLSPSD